MTIYEEMQALKDSVDKLHKKLEELREEIYDDILDSTALNDAIRTQCEENLADMEYQSDETMLLLGVLVSKVDELSGDTITSLRERQLMDAIKKRADQIRTARKKKRWR